MAENNDNEPLAVLSEGEMTLEGAILHGVAALLYAEQNGLSEIVVPKVEVTLPNIGRVVFTVSRA